MFLTILLSNGPNWTRDPMHVIFVYYQTKVFFFSFILCICRIKDFPGTIGTFPGQSGPSGQFSIFDRRHTITNTRVAHVKFTREVFRLGQMTYHGFNCSRIVIFRLCKTRIFHVLNSTMCLWFTPFYLQIQTLNVLQLDESKLYFTC